MIHHMITRLLKWTWNQLDTVFALLLGAVCSILAIAGAVKSSILASATLGTLTVLAFALLRDRLEREKLQSQLNQITSRFDDPSPDLFFRQEVDETSMLLDAEREIWIIQETGTYIIETQKALIVSLLRKGGTVRIVVTSPKEEITWQLAFRNYDFTYDAIINRFNLFRYHIDSITRDIVAEADRLQGRFIPYFIDTSSVLVDPSSPIEKKRRAIIRYPGFRVPFKERLGINLQGDISPKLFTHYFREAQIFFEHASKIVLITGAPHSGKTTTMIKLVEGINTEDSTYLFFVFSKAVWKGGRDRGFEVITSTNSVPRRFATRQSGDNYGVDIEVWAHVTSEVENAYTERKIIILDEIGSLQLKDPGFLVIIERILNDPNSFMFATVGPDDGSIKLLGKIKSHYRSTVLQLTPNKNERAETERILEQELKTALRTVKFIHHEF